MMDFRRRHNEYFHPHPLYSTYALIASLALAGLLVVVIAWSVAH
jgi:hypothetical protein